MSALKAWKLEKNYQRLFLAGTINGIGNRFSQVAIFTLLYQLTGSGMAIGLVLAIRMLPFLFFAPAGGVLADKFSKKHILITIDLLRIPLVLTLVFVQGESDVWIIYTIAFLLACGEALYSPVRTSVIPAMVKRDRLIDVNALEQAMIGIVLVVGASTGGVIAYLFGLSAPFVLNGMTFLASGLILGKIYVPIVRSGREKELGKGRISRKVFTGSTVLVTFFVVAVTMPLANGIDNVLMSVYALEVFAMGELGVGFIYAALGLGFIVSSFFSNVLRRSLLILTVVFIILEGIGHIVLSAAPTFVFALITVIFITFVGGLSNICIDTLMMKVIPSSKRGTMFGLMQALSNTALGISMASAGFLLELFDPRELSFIVGIVYISFTVIYAVLFSKLNLISEKRELLRKIG